MSDFLTNLIARSFTASREIQPRLPSRFEFAPTTDLPMDSPPSVRAVKSPVASPSLVVEEAVTGETPPAPKSELPRTATRSSLQPVAETEIDRPSPLPANENQVVLMSSTRTLATSTKTESLLPPPPSQPLARLPFTKSPNPSKQRAPAPATALDAEPRIVVSIGRVEVRAIHTPPVAQPVARPFQPKLSLDDYLRRQNRGSR